jgi:peroxiredoxin Q/BCP
MIKLMFGGAALLLLLASAGLWMLRPGSQRAEGTAAPDFALQDQNGQMHRLSDYAGRWLVLYFYPRDDTPGCTKEACRFRDDIGVLGHLNAAVVGVSVDDTRSHADFSKKFQLPFPLLADPSGQTAAAYGSLLNLGLMRFARRHTFIIAPDGRIAARFDKVDPATHAQEVARTLSALQKVRAPQTAPPSHP